ncbi:MAG TPA: TOBE domain-containing protein [Chitinispirillaceae bacterium]|nr:TOBE domain-containing protein [Chitinispirillaceae bacterium]
MTNTDLKHLAAPLWLLFAGRELLIGKAIELLRQIDSKGSLSKAAQAVPMSYKAAWDLIYKLNNISEHPVVISTTGGRHGGGTQLSEYGKSLISLYSTLERSYESVFDSYGDVQTDIDSFFKMIRGLCMKTSARNQLAGVIKSIVVGTINSEINIDIGKNDRIKAVITNESCTELGLTTGTDVLILAKASSVILFPADAPVKCSSENLLKGKVVEVRLGVVNAEVLLDLPGGKTITAVVTKESTQNLGIKAGMLMYASLNSSQVILALPL